MARPSKLQNNSVHAPISEGEVELAKVKKRRLRQRRRVVEAKALEAISHKPTRILEWLFKYKLINWFWLQAYLLV